MDLKTSAARAAETDGVDPGRGTADGYHTMWTMLTEVGADRAERDALVGMDDHGEVRRLSYGQLIDRGRHLSAGLAQLGVRRGDRVALWMTNSLEWVVCAFAIMRLGATLTPINTFFKPDEVRGVLAISGARHLISQQSFRALNFPEMIGQICPEFASAEAPGHLFSEALPDLRNIILLDRTGDGHPGAHGLGALEAIGRESAEARALADAMERETLPSDLGMIKFTSGSTGFPKGAMLEQGGWVKVGVQHARRIGAGPTDIYFSMMPFFHAGGSLFGLMTMLTNGGTLVFTEAFDAPRGVRLLAAEGVTMTAGILAEEMVRAGLEQGLTCPTVWMASAMDEPARRLFPNATFSFSAYGLTEVYGCMAITSPEDPPEKRGTGGRLLEGFELRVVDPETGADVPDGQVGEALVRGNIMRGYWRNPEQTARAIPEDGWLRTEDLVTRDDDGYVKFVARLKLMLKVGGENVSLEEVERVVGGHEAVAECGAVGVADPRKGEAVGLLVVARPGSDLDAASLATWIKARLARFKQPRRIEFVDAIPRLANGKVNRPALDALGTRTFAS